MRNIYVILVISILLLSCNNSREQYRAPISSSNYKVNVNIINDTSIFNNISNILICDSLLIVADITAENTVQIFSAKTGQNISSCGRVGKGPGELLIPAIYSIDHNRGDVVIFDYGKQGVMRYNILDNDEYSFESFSGDNSSLNNFRFVKDSIFISNGINERVALSAKSNIIDSDNSFKKCNDIFNKPKDWYLFMNNHSVNSVSPDGTKYVSGTLYGGILEIFSICNNVVNLDVSKYFYELLFKLNLGNIEFNEKTIFGFYHIYAMDDYFYATLFGITTPTMPPNKLYKFDWNGNLIATYEFQYPIECFVVDDNDKVYMIVYTNDSQVIGVADLK